MRVLPALFLLALCLSVTQADEFTFEEATPSLPAPAPPAAGDATAAEVAMAPDAGTAATGAAAMPSAPAPPAAAKPPPTSTFGFMFRYILFPLGLLGMVGHRFGRWRSSKVAEAASASLTKALRANFTQPFATAATRKEEESLVSPATATPGQLCMATYEDFEAYSVGREQPGGVLGAFTALHTKPRSSPTFYLPSFLQQRLGISADSAKDLLIIELPMSSATHRAPPGVFSLVEHELVPNLRRRGDVAAFVRDKEATLKGIAAAIPAGFTALGDHGALFDALLKGCPQLQAALQPGTPTLASLYGLHITDHATLAGLRTRAVSENCVVVAVKAPGTLDNPVQWSETLGAWLEVALACVDALGGLKTTTLAMATVEALRETHRREVAKREREEKARAEKMAELAKLSPAERARKQQEDEIARLKKRSIKRH